MFSLRKILSLSVFIISSLICLSHASTQIENFKQTIKFTLNGNLKVENKNGKISIEGWDKSEVYIEAEKRVNAESDEDAAEIMKQLKIEIEKNGDEISIYTQYPFWNDGFWGGIFGKEISAGVNYKIFVPKNCNVNAKSTNGALYIFEINGETELSTTNGKINAKSLKGYVNARTTNGSLKIELEQVNKNKEMEFITTNGSVTLYLPESINCNILAKTTNGSIRTDFPLEVEG